MRSNGPSERAAVYPSRESTRRISQERPAPARSRATSSASAGLSSRRSMRALRRGLGRFRPKFSRACNSLYAKRISGVPAERIEQEPIDVGLLLDLLGDGLAGAVPGSRLHADQHGPVAVGGRLQPGRELLGHPRRHPVVGIGGGEEGRGVGGAPPAVVGGGGGGQNGGNHLVRGGGVVVVPEEARA